LPSDVAPISVVIPAYNAENFIADAIRSVHAQTLRPTEIIVIADDCTDRTPQIAAELGAIVLEQKRRNMAAGLNLGISASTQPWIAFLDADDLWEKDKIALQWQAVQTCPAAIVSCDLCTLYQGKVMASPPRALRERWNNLESVALGEDCHFFERVQGDFLVQFYFQTTTVLLRRDVFSSVGIFDESLIYGQTRELFARVMARFPVAFVEKPLVYVRVHSSNHSRNLEGGWISYISIIERMLRNPDMYPKGAGKALRESLKRDFHHSERELARSRASTSSAPQQSQPSNPNQL
jgi:glycosyltransferase involved in cell wall biosynthesis